MASKGLVAGLFATALFAGSFLIFSIQPMIGKILLPFLGGSAFVWNSCLVFFQVVLLAGYLYVHILTTRFSVRTQWMVHLSLIALVVLTLPPGLPAGLAGGRMITDQPLAWVLTALLGSCGAGYFLLAATSPLLQSWYYRRFGEGADPYFLFAASNGGSIIALLAYPFLIEPNLRLAEQAVWWSVGFGVAATFVVYLGWQTKRVGTVATASINSQAVLEVADTAELEADESSLEDWERQAQLATWAGLKERLYWLGLAFVPSSLLVAVTTHLTTDIAAVPMLWILPLLLYLLTFVVTFLRYTHRMDQVLTKLATPLVIGILFLTYAGFQHNVWLVMTGHLVGFFLLSIACHGRLVLVRPEPSRLTEFYLFLALGGALGGAFNSVVAPHVFKQIAEYPLVCALLLFLLWSKPQLFQIKSWVKQYALPLASAAAVAIFAYAAHLGYVEGLYEIFYVVAIPCGLAAILLSWQRRSAFGVLVLALSLLYLEWGQNTIYRDRGLYGLLTVREYSSPGSIALVHGGILHGEQWTETDEDRAEPRSYYHRDGPFGHIFSVLQDNVEYPNVAAIGLGTGTIASYGHGGNAITFFELDPKVVELASNPRYFSYIDDCRMRGCRVAFEVGDGRLRLQESRETFDLIVVDAFTSDAIPVHLLTKEAVRAYFDKLNPGGMVTFHISNRYLDLAPVLLNIAYDLDVGYAVRTEDDDTATGRGASTWVVLAVDEELFGPLTTDERWGGAERNEALGVWADDYANVMAAFTWQ